jgi:hypothetical protein
MREGLAMVSGFAAAIAVAWLFSAGIEGLPDVGPVLFLYVAFGIGCTVMAFIGVARLVGGR